MRCPRCGSETVGNATFCERCGQRLFAPTTYQTPVTYAEPVRGRLEPWVKFMPFLGLIIVGIGAVVYALALSNMIGTVQDPNWDPYGTPDDALSDFRFIVASYVIMAIGTALFLGSLILIVIKSD